MLLRFPEDEPLRITASQHRTGDRVTGNRTKETLEAREDHRGNYWSRRARCRYRRLWKQCATAHQGAVKARRHRPRILAAASHSNSMTDAQIAQQGAAVCSDMTSGGTQAATVTAFNARLIEHRSRLLDEGQPVRHHAETDLCRQFLPSAVAAAAKAAAHAEQVADYQGGVDTAQAH